MLHTATAQQVRSGQVMDVYFEIMGNTVDATLAFHEVIEPHIRRISLIDTFNDEKFETLNVAQALGKDLYGVRLDTPGSRRGGVKKEILTPFPLVEAHGSGLPGPAEIRQFVIKQLEHVELE